MEIKVLGTGCAGCKALYETISQAVSEMKLDAKVVKVEDLSEIISYNVMRLPAIVVNEKVLSSGGKLSLQAVKALLNNI